MSARQPAETIDLAQLIDCASYTIRTASHHVAALRDEDFRGGYMVVHEIASDSVEMIIRLGPYDPAKAKQQIAFAQEKASRLHIRISGGAQDFTSYETRNPDENLFGGAVRAFDQILSFSGLPELWDEAAMFVVAIRIGKLVESETLQLISEDRNPHLRPLLIATAGWRFT